MWQNRNQFLTLCAVSLCIIFLTPFSLAEEVDSSVVTVIHIDAMPQFTQAAAAILIGFQSDSLREAGAKKFEILQEIDHVSGYAFPPYKMQVGTSPYRD